MPKNNQNTVYVWGGGNAIDFARSQNPRALLGCMANLARNTQQDIANLDNPNTEDGAILIEALSVAVKKNDLRTMIVLFSKKRAKHVLKNPILKSATHSKGRSALKALLSVTTANIDLAVQIASLHTKGYSLGTDWRVLDKVINDAHDNVKEALPSHLEKQVIVRALESEMASNTTPASKRKM